MANISVQNALTKLLEYFKGTGSGTDADPFIPEVDTPNHASRQEVTLTSADLTVATDLSAAPTAGQKIAIESIHVSSAAAITISFLEETSGTVIWRVYMAANGTHVFSPKKYRKLPVADKKLRVQASGAGNVTIVLECHSRP